MARAQPDDQWHEKSRRHEIGGWQELRSDLLGLLHESSSVDGRAGKRAAHLGHDDRPMPNDALDGRHRQALRAVTETMERFSARRNSDVDSAIAQIRRRHEDVPLRRPERISHFQDTVSGMSARLERLGSELQHTHTTPASLREIADQVAQLTDVVELLAGAVGESGQVKRLEAQITQLAKLVGEGRQPEGHGISQRLDRIASAIDQMSDMQQQYAERPLSRLAELDATHKSGFRSIEDGVRNIYDRIDALEQNLSLNPADVDRLSQEMATISSEMANMNQALKAGGGTSSTLLQRIDALNARVGQIEDGGAGDEMGGLRADISALREAVRETVEPRFSALKSQIDNLDQRIGKPGGKSDITPSQLEGQIRQLIARMDQTGEQLADIKQMYQRQAELPAGTPPIADIDALAEAIAKRTSGQVSGGGPVELSAANIDELELRLSKLFGAVGGTVEAGSFTEMQDSIRRVDDRLSRLESTLIHDDAPPAAETMQHRDWERPAADRPEPVKVDSAPRFDDRLDDAMDANPLDERPLVDPGFGTDYPSDAAYAEAEFDTGSTRSRGHAEAPDMFAMEAEELTADGPKARGRKASPDKMPFDPDAVERPAKPRSSLFADEEPVLSEPEAVRQPEAPGARQPVSQSSRNTFIEAARRAAQKQEAPAGPGAQSIIARALSRFQGGEERVEQPKSDVPSPAAERKLSRAEKKAAAKAEKAARARMQAEAKAHAPRSHFDEDDAPRESFISRHRRVLLLSAAVVTICLLTFNLIERRLNADNSAPEAGSVTESAPAAPDAAGEDNSSMLDPQPTGSIDPFVRVAPENPVVMTQSLPTVLSDAAKSIAGPDDQIATGSIPETPDENLDATLSEPVKKPEPSPIKLTLPPEAVGPLALREAAANGDPRAQFEVAAIYSEGQAVKKDNAEAAKWYERAAAQGFAPAEYRLGNLYEHGDGVTRDLMQAKLWYQRAAEAGNRMAMHNLAALYASGEMGKQEFSLAAEWFERAASQGLTDSQFNLGMLYARGLGLPQNMAVSYKWFSLAALRGDEGAAKARDDIARSLDAETVSRLKDEIAEWQPDSIDVQANFAPIGTWAENFNPGQTINERTIVEKVQSALNRLGYDVGTPDGLMGPRTRDAIRAFERETGMSESGAINPRLLAVLGSQPV